MIAPKLMVSFIDSEKNYHRLGPFHRIDNLGMKILGYKTKGDHVETTEIPHDIWSYFSIESATQKELTPNKGLGLDQKNMLKFLKKHGGWHLMHQDSKTLAVVKSLIERGLIEFDAETQQAKIK